MDPLSELWQFMPEPLGELLLIALLLWVLKRLRTTGNGQGLASLFRRVSRLNKDFGILVEIIDDLFPVSNPSKEGGDLQPGVSQGSEEDSEAD